MPSPDAFNTWPFSFAASAFSLAKNASNMVGDSFTGAKGEKEIWWVLSGDPVCLLTTSVQVTLHHTPLEHIVPYQFYIRIHLSHRPTRAARMASNGLEQHRRNFIQYQVQGCSQTNGNAILLFDKHQNLRRSWFQIPNDSWVALLLYCLYKVNACFPRTISEMVSSHCVSYFITVIFVWQNDQRPREERGCGGIG